MKKRKNTQHYPRILMGPLEISGIYGSLQNGFRNIGVDCILAITHPHPFGYQAKSANPPLAKSAQLAVTRFRESRGLHKGVSALTYFFYSVLLVLWLIPKFDVFISAWGKSYLPGGIDIILFRLCRKQVISNMGHGSEARPPFMSPLDLNGTPFGHQAHLKMVKTEIDKTYRSVRWREFIANQVICLGTTGHYLRKEFIDFYRLGIPTDCGEENFKEGLSKEKRKDLVILHAPSNRGTKGTKEIRDVIQNLKEQNLPIEYIELSGVSNPEILRQLLEVDLVIDQLWSDIPMPVISAEAGARGIPSIVGGYSWRYWQEWSLSNGTALPPTIMIEPEELKPTIIKLCENRKLLDQRGREALSFIYKVWNPERVARNYLEVILGRTKSSWRIDPKSITYPWGVGSSKEQTIELSRHLSKRYGSKVFRWRLAPEIYKHR